MERLHTLWTRLLGQQDWDASSDFFAAGGHSVLAMRMLAQVEKEFGIHVTPREFFAAPTLGSLTALVQRKTLPQQLDFSHAVRLGQGRDQPVFVVVHSNGAFFPFGHAIGQSHPFIALQAADRRRGGQLPSTVEAIAACYVRQILLTEPAGPYVVMGWCLAGTVAYEAARQLRAAGHAVAAVVMVDTWCCAPIAAMSPVRRRLAERSYSAQIVLTDLAKVLRRRTTLAAFLRRRTLTARFRRATPVPTGAAAAYAADQAFDGALLAQLRAAAKRYQPPPWDGLVLQIRSSEEPSGFGLPRDFGWRGLTPGARTVTVAGDHVQIFLEPQVRILTRHIRDALGLAEPERETASVHHMLATQAVRSPAPASVLAHSEAAAR